MPTSSRPVFRFGPFELQTGPPALYRDGQLVSITPKALATLTALVSSHGKGLSKEELLATVWSDTAVEESNLSQNIYTLRKLLGPNFPDQSPIENIPRFGYRFNLPVSEGLAAANGVEGLSTTGRAQVQAQVSEDSRTVHQGILPSKPLGASAHSGSFELFPSGPRPPAHAANAKARIPSPMTWLAAGVISAAVLSLLLFRYWDRETGGPPRLYSMVQLTANDSNNPVTAAAPSPDGDQIAYADDDGILLRARKGGLAHALRSPELYMVTRVAWFPDGLHLAVSGQDPKTHVATVWSVSATGDVPVILRTDAANAIPSPDGKRIAFEANRATEVWVSGVNGENAHSLLTAEAHKALTLLVWSPNGAELYISRHDPEHSALFPGKTPSAGEFLAVDTASAKVTAQTSGVVLDEACLLPGNRLLFAGNDGTPQVNATSLWEVPLAARSGAFRSAPRRVQTFSRAILALNSSQQGRVIDAIVSSGEADVYVAALDPDRAGLRDVHRLTYDVSSSYPHSWTPDSRSVLFESKHTGINQLYRQDIDSRNPTQLVSTPYNAALPRITPDGRWIFFAGGEGVLYHKLLRVSSEGGLPAEITLTRGMGQFRCPLLHGACVLRQTVENKVVFSRLDPLRGEGKPFYSEGKLADESDSFAVSPDGTELAMIRTVGASTQIRVVRFDSLDKMVSSSDVVAREPIEALQWSADGRGWFAEVFSPTRSSLVGHSLYFIDPSGNAKLLTQSIGRVFGIPSPDGKKVAMVEATRDSNIWSLQ